MATPGGLGAFIAVLASQCIYRVVTPGQAIDLDEAELVRPLTAAPDEAARVGLLTSAPERTVDPQQAEARGHGGGRGQARGDRPVRAPAGRPGRGGRHRRCPVSGVRRHDLR